MTANEKSRMQRLTVNALKEGALTKDELLSRLAKAQKLTSAEISDRSPSGKRARLFAELSEVAESLIGRGLVSFANGRYSLTESLPVTVRATRCEKEILVMLSERPMSKKEIRERLEEVIGTKRTATQKDDNILFSYLGQILKRLVNERTLTLSDGAYSISREKSAAVNDIRQILELKNEFLEQLHSKGGEFFEHYFMTLLSKYLSKHGKTIVESYVTGGSDDGGIDGVAKTVDCLGFRETVMIQTKNRNAYASETEVRSFYGAVCAKMGSRGIFVTSSDFHPTATEFLNSIDNCVGVGGGKIFDMAVECAYGIKKQGGKYVIDKRII